MSSRLGYGQVVVGHIDNNDGQTDTVSQDSKRTFDEKFWS